MVKCCIGWLSLFFFVTHTQAQITYPFAKKVEQIDVYHGVTVADPYRWLESDTARDTKKWIDEQNKLTNAYLEAIPFRYDVRKRMADFYNYARYSAPFRKGSHYYYYRNNGLENFSVVYRQSVTDTVEEKILDPNLFSNDGSVQLADFVPSGDGRFAAWGVSASGSDWQTYFVRDLTTMKDLIDTLRWIKISDIAWHNHGFYYTRYPQPPKGEELSARNDNHQVWYHRAGTPQAADQLIYQDTANPNLFYYVSTSEDERFVFLSATNPSKGLSGNSLFYLDTRDGTNKFQPIVAEITDNIYGVVDPLENDKFLVQTNEKAPNGKVMLFDPAAAPGKQWTAVIPEKKETLKLVTMAGGQLFAQYLKNVAARVMVYTTTGRLIREIGLPGYGNTDGFRGLRDDTLVYYTYNSLTYPTHIYTYNTKTGTSTLFRKPAIIFQPEDYVISQKFFTSRDGTRIPMFIVHKKGIRREGNNPTLMHGYGGFNVSLGPSFNNALMPWLEQGGVYVLVNLRGGGEFGERWHRQGMRIKKQNVFDDFIAAAEYLINKNYTSRYHLAIQGESNGGLLVAAVMNQRPDLFQVAVPEVGVLDMMRFQKFTIGWNWIAEYGNIDNREEFQSLLKYSPLHNIRSDLDYPATLIITADHDDRVVPAHSYKYTATLQDKYKGRNPILLKIDTNSGHGLSSIIRNIELASDIFSFILFNVGVGWSNPNELKNK